MACGFMWTRHMPGVLAFVLSFDISLMAIPMRW
ncbi:hypothetical protein FF1_004629 [Malus domestica]